MVANKYPLSSVHLRRAIAMSIDKSKLDEILHGGQIPATSFVPPKMLAYSAKVGLRYNPARAREELKLAGVDDATRVPAIELVLPNWSKQVTLAQFIQQEIKKNLGLTVVLQPFDHKTFRSQLDLHAFPLFEASWSADYPDPDNFLTVFMGDSGNNRTTWRNAKFDEGVLKARGLLNLHEREKIYLALQKTLLEEDAVIIPLYYEPNMALVRSRVQGLELNPLNYLLLRKVTLGPR